MADTAIEWADKVWNPVVGCDKVSAGCQACYAIRTAYRLEHGFKQPDYQGITRKLPDGSVNWTGTVRCLPQRLAIPLGWKKPARIFVNSMSDLFHEDVPETFILRVWITMALANQHSFLVLTKRPERMRDMMRAWKASFDARGYEPGDTFPEPNVWLGVSVEDQRAADERIPLLLQTPAAVRFLSCEPLLGHVSLYRWLEPDMPVWPEMAIPKAGQDYAEPLGECTSREHDGARWAIRHRPLGGPNTMEYWKPGIHWVIAGGESGPNYRPMDLDWARGLRDQCQSAGVAFHFKQIGGWTHAAGGRELDGQEWNQYPEAGAMRERTEEA